MASPDVNTLLGEKARVQGHLSVEGSLWVEGSFEGEILEVEQLFVGPKGKIKSNIRANNVDVAGLVIGNIQAQNRVFLRPTGKVLGNIQTRELIIQNGVVLEGNCRIGDDFHRSQSERLKALFSIDHESNSH